MKIDVKIGFKPTLSVFNGFVDKDALEEAKRTCDLGLKLIFINYPQGDRFEATLDKKEIPELIKQLEWALKEIVRANDYMHDKNLLAM